MPTVRMNTLTVDYVEAGTGTPVVFIPGITEFREGFAFQFHGLSDSCRLISYDLRRGLKRSTDYTLDLLITDLKGLLRALDLDRAVISGHSFGGLVAMEFALRHPEQTKALILISSYASPPAIPPDRLLAWTSSAGHPFHKSLGASFKVQIAKLLGRKTGGSLAMAHEITAVRTLAHQAARTSKTTINQRMRIIHRTDLSDRLPELTMPTLVVAGAKDRAVFLASAQQLFETIPNASLEVIEGGGHFCFVTRHDQFNAVVDEFLTHHLAEIL